MGDSLEARARHSTSSTTCAGKVRRERRHLRRGHGQADLQLPVDGRADQHPVADVHHRVADTQPDIAGLAEPIGQSLTANRALENAIARSRTCAASSYRRVADSVASRACRATMTTSGEVVIGRVREDPDRGAALAGLAVEREQAGMEPERSLGRHEDARVELSAPDQGRSTGGEGVAGVERTQSTPRDRRATRWCQGHPGRRVRGLSA